jgi:hypothetical protein
MHPKPPSEVLYDSATALRQVDNILAELGADDSESPTPALSRHDDNPVFRALRDCRELIATLRTSVKEEKRDLHATLDELDARFAALSAAAAAHAAHCPAGLDAAPQSPSSVKSAA